MKRISRTMRRSLQRLDSYEQQRFLMVAGACFGRVPTVDALLRRGLIAVTHPALNDFRMGNRYSLTDAGRQAVA